MDALYPYDLVTRSMVGPTDRLVGLVVRASASRAEDPGLDSRLRRDFSGSSHTCDLKTGNPVAALPGAGIVRPGVSIL